MGLRSASRLDGVLLAISLLGAAACSAGSGGLGLYGDAGAGEAGAGDTPTDITSDGGTTGSSCTSKYPASQSLSQPCCAARGADACGAGLFCAAFDGRTQTTCYAEGSRNDGQSCTADVQCSGFSCDPSGVCKKAMIPPPPPPGMCAPTCASNTDCSSTCPAVAGGLACCDLTAQICFVSRTAMCPGPP